MKKIELQTEFECLVVTEKEQLFLSPANTLIIEDESFAIYPATRKILPFVVSTSQKSGNHFRFFEKDGRMFCFLISKGTFSKTIVEKIKVEKENVEVLLSHNSLEIKSSTNNLCFDFEERVKKYKLSTCQNFLVVHLFFSSSEEVVLFCPSSGLCKNFFGKNFEFKDNSFTFEEEIKDFAKSVIYKKIVLEKSNLKEESLDLKKENFSTKKETVCFCFLECVKNQNFLLAKEFLAPSLQNVQEEKLKEYFQKPFKFFPLSLTEFVIVYPEDIKSISFRIEDDKIVDFEGL